MDKFTPGEWRDFVDDAGIIDLWRVHGTTREEALANARLIAAAPDLLQALRAARARLALIFESDDRDPRDDATVQEIDAAIEKATGDV